MFCHIYRHAVTCMFVQNKKKIQKQKVNQLYGTDHIFVHRHAVKGAISVSDAFVALGK